MKFVLRCCHTSHRGLRRGRRACLATSSATAFSRPSLYSSPVTGANWEWLLVSRRLEFPKVFFWMASSAIAWSFQALQPFSHRSELGKSCCVCMIPGGMTGSVARFVSRFVPKGPRCGFSISQSVTMFAVCAVANSTFLACLTAASAISISIVASPLSFIGRYPAASRRLPLVHLPRRVSLKSVLLWELSSEHHCVWFSDLLLVRRLATRTTAKPAPNYPLRARPCQLVLTCPCIFILGGSGIEPWLLLACQLLAYTHLLSAEHAGSLV